jgi:DNA-directed RNA polymerase specialized sigma24 family protein
MGGDGGRPWWRDPTQRWRLRYWRLWPGPSFDPDDLAQTCTYAFQRLSRREQAVFALCRFEGLDYPDIACRLGISVSAVERCLASALYKMSRLLDLIAHARGRQWDALTKPDQLGPDR